MNTSLIDIRMVALLTVTLILTPGITEAGWITDKKETAKVKTQKFTKKSQVNFKKTKQSIKIST